MPSNYKCPVCGCTDYYSLSSSNHSESSTLDYSSEEERAHQKPALIQSNLDIYCAESLSIRSFYVSLNAEVCLCAKCGHIDLFNKKLSESFRLDNERLNRELKNKKLELDNLENDQEKVKKDLSEIEEKTKKISKLLKSEDITIRQQKELQKEAKTINSNRSQLENKLVELDKEIRNAKKDYDSLKEEIDRVAPNK